MNTLDLLNEISTSKLAKKTDAQLLGIEKARQTRTRWTKENFLSLWADVEQNNLGATELRYKYGMNQAQYRTHCESYGLTYKVRGYGELSVDRWINEEPQIDIINGMICKDWCIKHNRSNKVYCNRKARLRKKGLVD